MFTDTCSSNLWLHGVSSSFPFPGPGTPFSNREKNIPSILHNMLTCLINLPLCSYCHSAFFHSWYPPHPPWFSTPYLGSGCPGQATLLGRHSLLLAWTPTPRLGCCSCGHRPPSISNLEPLSPPSLPTPWRVRLSAFCAPPMALGLDYLGKP